MLSISNIEQMWLRNIEHVSAFRNWKISLFMWVIQLDEMMTVMNFSDDWWTFLLLLVKNWNFVTKLCIYVNRFSLIFHTYIIISRKYFIDIAGAPDWCLIAAGGVTLGREH